MRHIVNFGLLFAFLALAITGVMAFSLPFSLSTTQIHIAAGLITLALVTLHLAGRLPYFRKQLGSSKKTAISRGQVFAIAASAALVFFLAGAALPPLSWLVNQSYETRNRAHIVRSSPLTGFGEPSRTRKIVRRIPNEPKSHALTLHLSLREDLESLPAIAVWAETTTGTMIETLYLQQSLAYSDKPVWEGLETQRNHILPLWRHRFTLVSGIKPDGSTDIVSGTTESHSYALDPYLIPGEDQKFIVSVEVNLPADPNENWPDKTTGQPSLLYTAYVKLDEGQDYYLLELTGHGGGAEESGNIQYDLDSVTTAKEVADLFLLKVER